MMRPKDAAAKEPQKEFCMITEKQLAFFQDMRESSGKNDPRILTVYGGDSGYEKIDEDGWYWDDQYPDRAPYKLSRDTAKELLRHV
jgi:hypothetical protein